MQNIFELLSVKILYKIYFYLWLCVCIDTCHVCGGIHEDQKKVLNLLELELQVAVICWMWVLRNKLGSSGRPGCPLICWAISLGL